MLSTQKQTMHWILGKMNLCQLYVNYTYNIVLYMNRGKSSSSRSCHYHGEKKQNGAVYGKRFLFFSFFSFEKPLGAA